MNIKKALDKLYSLKQLGVKLGLHNIIKLLDHLGNPQNELKALHVAGSNGKGSTVSFMASMLMEAGYKVGQFTSPHYVDFNERIRINGQQISDEKIAGFVESLDKYIDENEITFFEITTAFAFKYFAEEKVDFAVIETGLGGRLDATNTLNPIASVITSISLEHTRILGDTLEKVAGEKAGIIKKNVPVFIGDMDEQAGKVLVETAAKNNSPLYNFSEFAEFNYYHVKVSTLGKNFKIYNTPLKGSHQLKNAALAVKTISEILDHLDSTIYFDGIRNVVKNTGIEGRYEVYSENPKIIFDSAHNPEGMKAFVKEFKKEKDNYKNRTAVFCAMSDKNLAEMINIFAGHFTKVFVTTIDYERAASIDEMKELASRNNIKVEALNNVPELINEFIKHTCDDCLVILGSIYLIGDVKSKICNKRT